MTGLFDLKDGKVVIEPYILAVPEFKKVWDSDKSKDKSEAYKLLCYVFFITDNSLKNPYNSYPEVLRSKNVITDFIKKKDWEPDQMILDAIRKYKEMTQTPNKRLLASVNGTIDRMATYLENTVIDDDTVKIVIDTMVKVSDIINSSNKLEKAVMNEQEGETKVKGNNQIGNRER